MALFQPSTIAVSAACQTIADAAGASADSDMTNRASKSLFAAMKHFNNRYKWNWLKVESNPVTITAPFQVAIGVSVGQASATAAVGHGLKADDFVAGDGFQVGARITATASASVGFNVSATGLAAGVNAVTITATRDLYDLPSDFKSMYSIRSLLNGYAFRPLNRRSWDRSNASETDTSTPIYYDTFVVGSKGKVRLLQPPGASDYMVYRYHRRMTIPTTSATADVLDIPQDYDEYLIAWAKWHFLTDKNEGRGDQGTTWLSLATEGLTTMLKDQTNQPDEDLNFAPGHSLGDVVLGVNNVRYALDEPW